ncbi:hypothetical protein GCM10010245_14850 [Streptomyces spectabilis]|nr:hypothetical protein GCM10010245_14850 [Streptomyces spectabilis]
MRFGRSVSPSRSLRSARPMRIRLGTSVSLDTQRIVSAPSACRPPSTPDLSRAPGEKVKEMFKRRVSGPAGAGAPAGPLTSFAGAPHPRPLTAAASPRPP